MKSDSPPFDRGALGTAYSDPSTVDTTGNQGILGMEWVFEDKDFSLANVGVAPDRTNNYVYCRVVQNNSGGALLPKRIAKLDTTATSPKNYLGKVSGYAAVGDACGVVDEFLPSTGVPSNEIFWLVVQGPSKITCDAGATLPITIGSFVIPQSTAGNFTNQNVTQVTFNATAANNLQGAIGRLAENATTAGTDYLVNVRRTF